MPTTSKRPEYPLVIFMSYAKETKRTFVFESLGEDEYITSLYVHKEAFPDGPPDEIEVHVNPGFPYDDPEEAPE